MAGVAHLRLSHPRLHERVAHGVLFGRLEPRPHVAEVVRDGPVGDPSHAELVRLRAREIEELGLAEVAAVTRVPGVALALELVRLDDHVPDADPLGEASGDLRLFARQCRRQRGDCRRVGAEHLVRDRGDERGVDAARQAHHRLAHVAQNRAERFEPTIHRRAVHPGHVAHRAGPASRVLTRS